MQRLGRWDDKHSSAVPHGTDDSLPLTQKSGTLFKTELWSSRHAQHKITSYHSPKMDVRPWSSRWNCTLFLLSGADKDPGIWNVRVRVLIS